MTMNNEKIREEWMEIKAGQKLTPEQEQAWNEMADWWLSRTIPLAAVKEAVGKRIEMKRVRDRSFVGSGSSRKSMTGVHDEPKKTKTNKVLSDLLSSLGISDKDHDN